MRHDEFPLGALGRNPILPRLPGRRTGLTVILSACGVLAMWGGVTGGGRWARLLATLCDPDQGVRRAKVLFFQWV